MNKPCVTLLHNPTAGDEAHAGEHLTHIISEAGYECDYRSVKDNGWKKFHPRAEFVVVAGGDGTVRKTVKALLKKETDHKIGLLPSGTANNIALSLGLKKDRSQNIADWKRQVVKRIDIGLISGLGDHNFLLESFGCGILPALMRRMKQVDDKHSDQPEKRLDAARQVFAELALNHAPQHCKISIDGRDHTGDYILVEVLNMPYIGPNLRLSAGADAGDGNFDVVLVTADARKTLADLVDGAGSVPVLSNGYQIIRGRQIELEWAGTDAHVDDQLVNVSGAQIKITLKNEALQFLI